MENTPLKVSSKSNPNSVAGAIAAMIKENDEVVMYTIGAGSLNQAMKAVAISRGFVAPAGINIACIPAFRECEVDGEKVTGIAIIIFKVKK